MARHRVRFCKGCSCYRREKFFSGHKLCRRCQPKPLGGSRTASGSGTPGNSPTQATSVVTAPSASSPETAAESKGTSLNSSIPPATHLSAQGTVHSLQSLDSHIKVDVAKAEDEDCDMSLSQSSCGSQSVSSAGSSCSGHHRCKNEDSSLEEGYKQMISCDSNRMEPRQQQSSYLKPHPAAFLTCKQEDTSNWTDVCSAEPTKLEDCVSSLLALRFRGDAAGNEDGGHMSDVTECGRDNGVSAFRSRAVLSEREGAAEAVAAAVITAASHGLSLKVNQQLRPHKSRCICVRALLYLDAQERLADIGSNGAISPIRAILGPPGAFSMEMETPAPLSNLDTVRDVISSLKLLLPPEHLHQPASSTHPARSSESDGGTPLQQLAGSLTSVAKLVRHHIRKVGPSAAAVVPSSTAATTARSSTCAASAAPRAAALLHFSQVRDLLAYTRSLITVERVEHIEQRGWISTPASISFLRRLLFPPIRSVKQAAPPLMSLVDTVDEAIARLQFTLPVGVILKLRGMAPARVTQPRQAKDDASYQQRELGRRLKETSEAVIQHLRRPEVQLAAEDERTTRSGKRHC